MAEYQLTATDQHVLRTGDGVSIPNSLDNLDWAEYQAWLDAGGVPDPYIEPVRSVPGLSPDDQIMFNHENRIRTLEGVPVMTLPDYISQKATLKDTPHVERPTPKTVRTRRHPKGS